MYYSSARILDSPQQLSLIMKQETAGSYGAHVFLGSGADELNQLDILFVAELQRKRILCR